MANIARNGHERELAAALWDPFRLVREALRWDPARELEGLGAVDHGSRGFTPRFDVKETKGSYVFKLDVPGVKEENINISLTGNRLTIAGRREQERREDGEQYFGEEALYGHFNLAFTVPTGSNPDGVTAQLDSGVLTVTVAKRPEVQSRRIPIATGAGEPKARA